MQLNSKWELINWRLIDLISAWSMRGTFNPLFSSLALSPNNSASSTVRVCQSGRKLCPAEVGVNQGDILGPVFFVVCCLRICTLCSDTNRTQSIPISKCH